MGFGGVLLPFGPLGGGSTPPPAPVYTPSYFWQPEPGLDLLGKWSAEPPVTKGANEMIWANHVTVDKRINIGPGVTKFIRVGLWFKVEGSPNKDVFNTGVNGSSVLRVINFGTRVQPIEGMRR